MATDFSAFYKRFTELGIDGDYVSLYDLKYMLKVCGDLIYGRDYQEGKEREIVLTQQDPKFYTHYKRPVDQKNYILQWIRNRVQSAPHGKNIILVLVSPGSLSGGVCIGGEPAEKEGTYLTSNEICRAMKHLPRSTTLTIINTGC